MKSIFRCDLLPLYVIILEDTIRKNTRETLDYFHREGVDVKVISGDHLKTVSMIAKKAGLRRWNDAIDLSAVGEDADFDRICQDYAVFARVTPKQKQLLVQALKRGGHQVAMTGRRSQRSVGAQRSGLFHRCSGRK